MRDNLRDQVEHPGLRSNRSKDLLQALLSPGRILVCTVRTELVKKIDPPMAWVISVMFKLERREAPSVPLLNLCVTKDLCETATPICSRLDLTDKNS